MNLKELALRSIGGVQGHILLVVNVSCVFLLLNVCLMQKDY